MTITKLGPRKFYRSLYQQAVAHTTTNFSALNGIARVINILNAVSSMSIGIIAP